MLHSAAFCSILPFSCDVVPCGKWEELHALYLATVITLNVWTHFFFFLSKVETVPLLYEFAYEALGVTPCGGPNLQYIKLCKLHFRWGDKVSKHFQTTFRGITRSLWCGGLKGWRVLVGPLHTHSINTMLQPFFLLAGGSREWCCFPSLSSSSFNSLVVHPRPCPPVHFIRQPISVFGQSRLCKRSKYLFRTPL